MFLLYMWFAGNNRQTGQELLSAFASLMLISVFIIILPIFVEKYHENNWLLCISVAAIGLVYSFVEMGAFAVVGGTDFRYIFQFVGSMIFIIGFAIMSLGTIYMYSYIMRRFEKQTLNDKKLIEEKAEKLLDAFPFGGITTMFNVYTVLLLWMSTFIGTTLGGWKNNNTLLGPLYLILFFILPPIIGWFFGRTLPRKYYLSKIQNIIDTHNKKTEVNQNGKRK